MPSLNTAITFEEIDVVLMHVTKDLNFDVSERFGDMLLSTDGVNLTEDVE
jgi:hypothetical protein